MRDRGKPRIRWEDIFQKGVLQILGTRGWARTAGYRKNGGIFERCQGPEGAVASYLEGRKKE
jgi:hypothetical protein